MSSHGKPKDLPCGFVRKRLGAILKAYDFVLRQTDFKRVFVERFQIVGGDREKLVSVDNKNYPAMLNKFFPNLNKRKYFILPDGCRAFCVIFCKSIAFFVG